MNAGNFDGNLKEKRKEICQVFDIRDNYEKFKRRLKNELFVRYFEKILRKYENLVENLRQINF